MTVWEVIVAIFILTTLLTASALLYGKMRRARWLADGLDPAEQFGNRLATKGVRLVVLNLGFTVLLSRVKILGRAVVSVLKENRRHGKTTIDPG